MFAILATGPVSATELWSRGDASLDLAGSLREIVVGTKGTNASDFDDALAENPIECGLVDSFPDCPAWDTLGETDVWTSLTRLRLKFDARATRNFSATVVYDNEMLAGTLDTFEAQLGSELGAPRFDELGQVIADGEHYEWRHGLYRGFLFFESQHLEVTLGRQRVPWGVGRLWNPIDRFNAIPPLAIQPDQTPGADAVKARWLFSGFTYLEAIYAVGEHSDDRAFAGRLHGVLRDVDYSLVAGVFEEAPTLGFDLAGNLFDAAGRLEGVWTNPTRTVRPFDSPTADDLPAFWQIVASIDTNFDVGNGIYVLLEHLYNGNALGFGRGKAGSALGLFQERDAGPVRVVDVPSSDLFGSSRVVTSARNLTGAQLAYDFTPELRGSLLVLYDWEGSSASFFPSATYNPFAWLELILGAQFFAGSHFSQFGESEPLGFLQAEIFF